MEFIKRIYGYIIVLILFINIVYSDEILGCGGFVKSDIDINFSQVEVKLYTKQGSLKDHTDCAPNNGYYFLPLYDKGEYVLKIEPPVGWSFEPKEVNLNVDGVTDRCSQGKDINFIFKGFAVIGKVVSAGSQSGPKGVRVSLLLESKRNDPPVHDTVTTEDGNFQFTPVLPGRFEVRASHPRWQLLRNSVPVQLVNSNVNVPAGSLVVAGYDVSGSVTSDDEPIKGVSFVLFQTEGAPGTYIQGCDKTPLTGFRAGANSLCHVNSDEGGKFLFPSLPPGRYRVVPHYEGPQNIKFDVRPVSVEFVVAHDSVQIDTRFQVKGFSVSGRVLLHPNGKGIAYATILLDGVVTSQTREDGSYHLENMQAGSYTLQVQANDMKFSDISVKITPNTPQLADIYPSAFKVCGSVAPHQLSPETVETTSRHVLLSKSGVTGQPIIVEIKHGSGEFCQFLEPGKYEVSVKVSEYEHRRGLKFTPTVQTIEVTDSPILSGIYFTQLKVELSGKLQCFAAIQDCGNIPIILHAIPSDNPNSRVSAGIAPSEGGHYKFIDILPGKYQVSVDKEDWCWESTSHIVSVASAKSTVPVFKQTGFSVTIISSHNTQVDYKLQTSSDKPSPSTRLHVKQGTTKSCLSTAGVYEFTPIGCHGYPQPSVTCSLSVATPTAPIILTAVSHSVGGRVVSQQKVSDLHINVMAEGDIVKMRLGPLKAEVLAGGRLSYKFELLVNEGEILTFVPTANVLLFTPPKSTIVGPTDCTETAVEFFAEKGHLIEGRVLPLLAGVKITVLAEGREDVVVESITADDGKFKFGPLPGDMEYRVAAEKEGYVLSGPDSQGNFNAHKLAEVIVEVLDKADGKPLQGVLLSLSGGESFRRNSQTGPNGKRTFSSLSPSEYYLRPMMKEYRFEPSSKMITVVEGATVNVQLQGHQVAFSAYGFVTSLSGEPEEGVVVEAVGMAGCSQYQEESNTEANGAIRIRGLQPKCEYTVRVKHGPSVNQHIQRSTPDGIVVKAGDGDITGLKLIVFHPLTSMDLSALVHSTVPEHLRTLRAKLCREDAPDSPIHVVKLDPNQGKSTSRLSNSAMVLFPSIPVDGRGYFIQLESTLSRTTHSYNTHAVHFKANSSFKHVKLSFIPESKVTEQDLGHSSYMALPLIIVGLLAYLNQQKLLPILNKMAESFNGSVISNVNNGRSNPAVSDHNGSDAVMVEPVLNVRSRKVKPRKT